MNLRAEFRKLALQWQGVSVAQRSQFVAGLCIIMIGFYAVVVWPISHKKLNAQLYKEEKLNMRIKNSGAGVAPKPVAGDLDATRARDELAKAQAAIDALKAEQARLSARFITLDDLDGLQSLKSELTRLAEASNLEIVALEHLYGRAEDRDRPPTPDRLKQVDQGNPYQRPLLRLRARVNYHGLMRFLGGLQGLPHIAAPVWSDISVISGKAPTNAKNRASEAPSRTLLNVEIRLAI
jgi:hypothetical protein